MVVDEPQWAVMVSQKKRASKCLDALHRLAMPWIHEIAHSDAK
jgi:hypothetical protein